MQELRLVAVSEDGTYLVLATAGRGTRFTLPVDDRLRAAVRGHFSRLGQFEIEVENPLRPKEIQARIRSGETAEEIAESAGIPVERVRWFEGPVLQEREYMAQQAQRVSVRRPGESTPGPPLGETVEERLGRGGVDLDEVEWDSWKCEDGTWRVRLSFFEGGRPHAAEWTFDPRRRHVSPLDEIAARLTSVEWDDDALSDTVTPLVPRRPAMKVVGSDRDRDVRGLPPEPEQPGPPGSLRAAEPREYIIERGRMIDPRPAFREPPGTAPLREASAPLGRHEAAQAPATPRPHDEDDFDLTETREPEAVRPRAEDAGTRDDPATGLRDASRARDEGEARQRAGAGVPSRDERGREEPRRPALDERQATAGGAREQEVSEAPQEARGASVQDERETAQGGETSPATQSTDTQPQEARRERETAPTGTDVRTTEEAGQAQQEARGTSAQDEHEVAQAGDTTPANHTVQPQDHDETGDARQGDSAQGTRGESGAAVRDEREVAAGEAVQPDDEDEDETGEAHEAHEAHEVAGEAARARDGDEPDARPDAEERSRGAADAGRAAPVQKPPAPRQPARAPAKKKPGTRPTMPAAQDKPATGSPAAAASSESTPAQRPARRRKSKAKRASVPSWDEIMFGARRPD
ncbi:septation protein SepH [Actinomadura latina]|uniref:septation protein SepH n=1 Tax=Actinomadura latina TaxID=163603 RepID=UPI000A9EA2B1|nr:septation protein SepH [Actinomadura latina]